MSEKRFFTKINKNGRNVIIDKECHIEIIDLTLACEVLNRLDLKLKTYNGQLGEQQDNLDELEKNFDDLVKWASEIAKRNVILDEKIGKIQQAIRIAYEKKPYPTIEDIQKEINNE